MLEGAKKSFFFRLVPDSFNLFLSESVSVVSGFFHLTLNSASMSLSLLYKSQITIFKDGNEAMQKM